ncbi:MAG: hypothetical protein HY682_09565 [Chloroflexi bacterium]|nr:hypothetical protein [Chloroflexota bacterium]
METGENGSPKLAKDSRKTPWSFLDPGKRCAKFVEKFCPEAPALTVVPRCRFEGIPFSLRPNLYARHLPTGAQALLYTFNNLLPRSGFCGSSPMCR